MEVYITQANLKASWGVKIELTEYIYMYIYIYTY